MKAVALIVTSSLILAGCAVNSGVVTTAPDTYFVSRQAATGFTGLSGLYPEALKEASEQCAKMGKQYIELGRNESKPPYILGNFPRVEIQFRCGKIGPKESTQCFKNLAGDPELVGLKDKVSLGSTNDQTFTMLSDKSKPTAKEKELLKLWGNKRDTCMKLQRADMQEDKTPLSVVSIANSSNAAAQYLVADLMNGDLTYATYAMKRQELNTFYVDTLNKIEAELRKETQDSRYKAEQLAIEAQRNDIMRQKIYSDSANTQQAIQSNERINQQNNLMRPRTTTTNCTANGSSVNCTSY
jgi:hypothetical protein